MGQKKSRKIPSKFPTKFSEFPCEKAKEITDELLQEVRVNSLKFFPKLLRHKKEKLLSGNRFVIIPRLRVLSDLLLISFFGGFCRGRKNSRE